MAVDVAPAKRRAPTIIPTREDDTAGVIVREATSKHLGGQPSHNRQHTRRLSVTEELQRLKMVVKKYHEVIFPYSKSATTHDNYLTVILVFTATMTPFEIAYLAEPTVDALFVANRIVDLGFFYDVSVEISQIHRIVIVG
jgi:hypothetical protein